MSETSGRCRREITAAYERTSFRPNDSGLLIADAIDRLAADVAAIKEAVCGNHSKTSNSSPTAPQPAAPPAGWLTERERHVMSSMLSERPCDWSLHWADDVQPVFRAILARSGSPPVVEVPAMQSWEYTAHEEALAYRDAMDKAGVAWKEV